MMIKGEYYIKENNNEKMDDYSLRWRAIVFAPVFDLSKKKL